MWDGGCDGAGVQVDRLSGAVHCKREQRAGKISNHRYGCGQISGAEGAMAKLSSEDHHRSQQEARPRGVAENMAGSVWAGTGHRAVRENGCCVAGVQVDQLDGAEGGGRAEGKAEG